jgi:hypothetical protein
MLQIPATVDRSTKINPNGTKDACIKTDPAPRPAPIKSE